MLFGSATGALTGGGYDAATQGLSIGTGIQEEYSFTQTGQATAFGALFGAGAAGGGHILHRAQERGRPPALLERPRQDSGTQIVGENPRGPEGVPNTKSTYSGSVYDDNFVGPVNWETFYRGENGQRTHFTSSLAQGQGVDVSRASYLDAKNNGVLSDMFDRHGNLGSQDLPTIGVTKDPVVAEYFARGPGGKNPDPYVTEFKIQQHLAEPNFENRRSFFGDINESIGRPELEYIINTEIPPEAIIRQWRVK